MTGLGVERKPRTAYPAASVPSIGVSPLMPPHSQGAERRRGRRAGRTGSRWGLRVLVIGGLAGAAWLLSGAAAHAADRDPAAEGSSLGSSLIGSVVPGDDQDRPVVIRVLDAAARPLESDRRHSLGSVTALPSKLVGTLDEATHDGVIRELTAPVRLAGVAVDTRTLAPVTDLPRYVAAPVPNTATPPTGAEIPQLDAQQVDAVRISADPVGADPVGGEDVPAAERKLDRQNVVGKNVVGKTVARQHVIVADRHPAAARAAAPETVRDTPGGDGPAPLRVHLGAANGVPASGSGTGTDGGSAAFLPGKVADSTVACHRLPIATDVEVRRYDAGAPTVSPD